MNIHIDNNIYKNSSNTTRFVFDEFLYILLSRDVLYKKSYFSFKCHSNVSIIFNQGYCGGYVFPTRVK